MYFPAFVEPGTPELLTIMAAVSFVLLLANYLFNYLPVSRLKKPHLEENVESGPVTLIICARNEEDNLRAFLPAILKQDYPEFEVVVVDDCSEDNTGNIIDEFAAKHSNLRKATIKEDAYYKHGKKFAMLVGIKSASHNALLFTDADCYPSSDKWLQLMANGFAGKKEIVLGFGGYEKKDSFLNRLIRYDTFANGVFFLGSAIRRKPYMGLGRNLAYTKELFFRHKGFSTHYHLKSGDDDLFVNQASTPENTNVCIDAAAMTFSVPANNFREWKMQKARHLTTAPLYRSSDKWRLWFNHFSQYFFYVAIIALAFSMKTVLLIPIALFLKAVVQILVLRKAARKLSAGDLLPGIILYELILLLIYPIFHATKLFDKQKKWTN